MVRDVLEPLLLTQRGVVYASEGKVVTPDFEIKGLEQIVGLYTGGNDFRFIELDKEAIWFSQSKLIRQQYFFLNNNNFDKVDLDKLVSWSPVYAREGKNYILIYDYKLLPSHGMEKFYYEYCIQTGEERHLKDNFEPEIKISTDQYHFSDLDDRSPGIMQFDHDLNMLWHIDEATLQEYAPLDQAYLDVSRRENHRPQVRNLQIFGDTLYYMYNFHQIVAVDVHTGAFKHRFNRLDNPQIGKWDQKEYWYQRSLHAGRYSDVLHAHIGVETEWFYEIDYATLRGRVRPIDIPQFKKSNLTTVHSYVVSIDKDRMIVNRSGMKELAIVDYHTLETLDYIRLDEEQPSGYIRDIYYFEGKIYASYMEIGGSVVNLYVVDVEG